MTTTTSARTMDEIAVDSDADGVRNYVEVRVDEGEALTTVYAEDADGSGTTLELAVDELDDLIEALIRARDIAARNR